jgi:hypothetical protein
MGRRMKEGGGVKELEKNPRRGWKRRKDSSKKNGGGKGRVVWEGWWGRKRLKDSRGRLKELEDSSKKNGRLGRWGGVGYGREGRDEEWEKDSSRRMRGRIESKKNL